MTCPKGRGQEQDLPGLLTLFARLPLLFLQFQLLFLFCLTKLNVSISVSVSVSLFLFCVPVFCFSRRRAEHPSNWLTGNRLGGGQGCPGPALRGRCQSAGQHRLAAGRSLRDSQLAGELSLVAAKDADTTTQLVYVVPKLLVSGGVTPSLGIYLKCSRNL